MSADADFMRRALALVLHLDTAVGTTTFNRRGVTYPREVFSSAPDQVVAIRLTADKPGRLNFSATWATPFPDAVVSSENGLLTLSGKGSEWNGKPGAIRFKSLLRTLNDGGSVKTDANRITVTAADSVTLLVCSGTNFGSATAVPFVRSGRNEMVDSDIINEAEAQGPWFLFRELIFAWKVGPADRALCPRHWPADFDTPRNR